MSKVRLMFFATLRDQAGTRTAELELPAGATVAALRKQLAAAYPALARSVESALVAINREYADNETVVPDGAEVALFPPVSGGSTCVRA